MSAHVSDYRPKTATRDLVAELAVAALALPSGMFASGSTRTWLWGVDSAVLGDAGGGTRTPDTRIMIPPRFGSAASFAGAGGHNRGRHRRELDDAIADAEPSRVPA